MATRAHLSRRVGAAPLEEPQVRHGRFLVGEALLLALIAALAVAVKGHPAPFPGDVGITLGVQHLLLPHRLLTNLLDGVSTINWPQPAAVILVVVTALLLVLRRWLAAIVVVLSSCLADLSSWLTNEIVRRPRPFDHGIHVLRKITNYYSFPSGHVVHALAFCGILLFLAWRVRRPAAWLWVARVVLVALIVLMGPSRVLEGEHWPSDVVEGLLIGAFWLLLGVHAYMWAARRWPRGR